MGLRCSLLGHSFGDSEVEREREEQGSEVVVTIREEQTCSRCGKTKLVSENKEVTSMATRESTPDTSGGSSTDDANETAAGGANEDADATGGFGADDGSAEEAAVAGDGRDAEIIDGGPDDSVPEATREAASVTEEDESATASEPASGDDDAVILDESEDEQEPKEREHGEWPDADDTRQRSGGDGPPAEWPDADGEDEGYDAEPAGGEPADVEFGGGLKPEAGGDADADGQMVGGDTGFTSADAAPSPVEADREREATEYVCPECGHTAAGNGSSLRAGDICPECRRGYLAER
ncbi:hypothetical protein SAMN06269185_3032 [Natronoarchaeum philippinense]|uniref:Uncharacterized protein n=1 Tax=Natronoarchaeum philippinense TaxID=558529 RepID=A0A285P6V1_NATPI|nr:oxidoreductase [Natronoarchaeum philippinense]SNZ17465.1 hypothetical protein SAMN06269185_3032 [Natronoarchaeum philippinense]